MGYKVITFQNKAACQKLLGTWFQPRRTWFPANAVQGPRYAQLPLVGDSAKAQGLSSNRRLVQFRPSY